MGVASVFVTVLLCLLLFLDSSGEDKGVLGMELHFYDHTCPSAERIVQFLVQERYNMDKSIAPNLIRLLLHDCFVRGCDASILLRSTPQNKAERDAEPNMSLAKSFDLIDEIKERLEEECPQTVSCADIIAIAARDAVNLVGGQYFELLLGRHDGMVSSASEVLEKLPDLRDSLPQALLAFQAKGFTAQEFLALLGAHSIGTTPCKFVEGRLRNYEGTGKADPSMDPSLVHALEGECKTPGTRVALDQGTPFALDNSYYKELLEGRGLLALEQQLVGNAPAPISTAGLTNTSCCAANANANANASISLNLTLTASEYVLMKALVLRYAHRDTYFQAFFQHSFKKLGLLEVLTHAGQTRRKCYQTNAT